MDIIVEQVNPSKLKPATYNPRKISAAELDKLKRSLQQFGFVDPAIVRRSDLMIIGGHQRVEAAIALGMESIPVVMIDASDNDAKLLNLALNKISGEWDESKLSDLLHELSADGADVALSGFDSTELDELIGSLDEPLPKEETSDAPENINTCPHCGFKFSSNSRI